MNPKWPSDPFHVLISTMLSQRTRDDNTRKASDQLFSVYPEMGDIAYADLDHVAELIHPAGFPNQKAKAVVEASRMILEDYGGEVPTETEELMKLPLVGRKTAACVRAYAMKIPSICVDTHVHRLSNLIGLVNTKTPEQTEDELMIITPKDRWCDINRYMVRHGQIICKPTSHDCPNCVIATVCDACIIDE